MRNESKDRLDSSRAASSPSVPTDGWDAESGIERRFKPVMEFMTAYNTERSSREKRIQQSYQWHTLR